MPATHHRDFTHQLRVLLVFTEFNILICILMERQRTHLNPPPSPAIQPPAQPQPQPAPRRSHPTSRSCYRFFRDKKRDATATSWLTSYTHHRIKNSLTNFRKSLEVGLKLSPTPLCSTTGWLATPPSANSTPRSAKPPG